MDRRNFLRFLGLGGAAAVVAPTKAYSFLGGILRPKKPEFTMNQYTYDMLRRQTNPPVVGPYDFMDLEALVAEMGGRLGIKLARSSQPFVRAIRYHS